MQNTNFSFLLLQPTRQNANEQMSAGNGGKFLAMEMSLETRSLIFAGVLIWISVLVQHVNNMRTRGAQFLMSDRASPLFRGWPDWSRDANAAQQHRIHRHVPAARSGCDGNGCLDARDLLVGDHVDDREDDFQLRLLVQDQHTAFAVLARRNARDRRLRGDVNSASCLSGRPYAAFVAREGGGRVSLSGVRR